MATDDEKTLYRLDANVQNLTTLFKDGAVESRDWRRGVDMKLDTQADTMLIYQSQLDRIKERMLFHETADAELGATLVRTVTRVEEIDRDVSKLGGTIDSVMTWRESFYPEPASLQKKRAIGLVSGASIVTLVALVQWWNEVTQFFKGFGR